MVKVREPGPYYLESTMVKSSPMDHGYNCPPYPLHRVKKKMVAILDFTDVKNVTEGREGGDQARFFMWMGRKCVYYSVRQLQLDCDTNMFIYIISFISTH